MSIVPSICAFLLTATLLGIVQSVVNPPMLLMERFLPGSGWVTVFGLAVYAAWIVRKLRDRKTQARWRTRIWVLFSAIFFLQLTLGIIGIDQMLMTGDLHLPVPALIAAGPIYRGGRLFMLILFGATILLVGPAWCSHLCYIGAWDNQLARRRKKPVKRTGAWQPRLRVGLLILVVGGSLLARELGASLFAFTMAALVFGIVGVLLMLTWSRRTGTMAHCSWYCPIGLLATVLGKLSPHRMKISDACVDCGACSLVCRYDALSPDDITRRRPGISCTLCGDCIGRCHQTALDYRFFGLSGRWVRPLFITLVVTLHAVSMGVARM